MTNPAKTALVAFGRASLVTIAQSLVFASAFGLAALAQAQTPDRPNFAGHWTPDPTKSRTAGGPRVATTAPAGEAAAVPVSAPRVTEPRKTRDVPPVYPPDKIQAGLDGAVILQATINTNGRVVDLEVLRATPGFEQAAIKAVAQWEYAPAMLDGAPLPIVMGVTVNFNLGRPGGGPSPVSSGRGRGGSPPALTIKQDEKSLKITRQNPAGSETVTYRFDGKASKNTLSAGGAIDGKYVYVSRWEDGTLVSRITFRALSGPAEISEKISIVDGALVIEAARPSPLGSTEPLVQTRVYVRRP